MQVSSDKLLRLSLISTTALIAVAVHTLFDLSSLDAQAAKFAKESAFLWLLPLFVVVLAVIFGRKSLALTSASIALFGGAAGEYAYYTSSGHEDRISAMVIILIAYGVSAIVAFFSLAMNDKSASAAVKAHRTPAEATIQRPIIRAGALEVRLLELRVRHFGQMALVIAAPPIVLMALLSFPIVGNIMVLQLANGLGCTVNAAQSHPCMFIGHDIGPTVYNYAVGSLLFGFMNIFILIGAIFGSTTLLVGLSSWLILVIWLLVVRSSARARLADIEVSNRRVVAAGTPKL